MISNNSLKKLLSTPKGRLIGACCMLGFVWLILLLSFSRSFFNALPSEDNLRDAGRELKKVQNELARAVEEEKKFDSLNSAYNKMTQNVWVESKHGMAEVALRQKISETATKLELKPNSLGTVRVSRINNEFYYAELDIMMNASYEEIIKFIAAVDQITPHLSWRRINMRPDFRYRPNNGKNSGTLSAARAAAAVTDPSAVRINFNAVIRVIGFDGKLPQTPVKKESKVKK